MKRKDALRAAPPAPACFEARDIWISYLLSAQDIKTDATKPFVRGVFNPGFSHCIDCSVRHRLEMQRQGRCFPVPMRGLARVKEKEPA